MQIGETLHVQAVVRKFDKQLYGIVYAKLIHRHQNGVDANGEYFEKLLIN